MRTRLAVLGAALLAAVSGLGADAPPIENAKVETRSAAAGLEQAFRPLLRAATAPVWIGYAAPALPGHESCCWDSVDGVNSCCGGCRLESQTSSSFRSGDAPDHADGVVRLEGPTEVVVLFRAEAGAVVKIRAYSKGCRLDGGGLPFHWLTDVRPAESLSLLGTFVPDREPEKRARRIGDSAIAAIALHADPAADAALERLVAPDRPEWVRRQAAFWMGNARGARGFATLKRLVREDKDERFREHAVFALSQSRERGAVETIVAVAHDDASARVRGQALFWLAQKAGARAVQAITAAIESDPETEVKKRAVFALSQLPKDEGVPLLIQTAKANKNPAVRKQAMFWLGQSKDPRALQFFEEILGR